jgi:DNA-binding MarR family transcriptional regulator
MRLRQILQELSKHSELILENFKISVPQLICLNEVFQNGPISIGALTKNVFLNNSTATGIIDRLEKRELVRRIRISKDRRQVHIEISEQGIEYTLATSKIPNQPYLIAQPIDYILLSSKDAHSIFSHPCYTLYEGLDFE